MEIDLESIFADLGVKYTSEGERRKIKSVCSIRDATENDLSFCWHEGEKGLSLISASNAGVILCKTGMEGHVTAKPKTQYFFLDNPRFAFVHIANKIVGTKKNSKTSTTAIVSDTANIGKDCYIGDFVTIGENCSVGDGSIIGEGVKLVQNCIVGTNCIIQPGVAIGADGFAFERYPNGRLEKFPHVKGVRIGNNVEICSNSSIARGSLSDTIIGDDTKIDALVHIAHNVNIGKNCQITAGTIIGGSTSVGDMSWAGLNSTLKDNIRVGTNVIVAAAAAVMHDVSDGDIVAGVPAKSIKDKVKSNMLFQMAGQKESHG
jgi:UDP-3-O-[3-hydroxymyristoyl] glucosamine N-acyltransferase